MGYMRHHAILVTTWSQEHFDAALVEARRIFPPELVAASSEPAINGWRSICVFPDGSKEGWADSDMGDARRKAFVEFLDGERYEDGSSAFSWAEVRFGDEEGLNGIEQDDEHVGRGLFWGLGDLP